MDIKLETILFVIFCAIFLRWLYSILYPRKEITIKTNGKIIKRKRVWLSFRPLDVINVEPNKGAGHYNIQFTVPPDIGLVTFHIQCFMEGPDKYILRNGKAEYFGFPV